MFDARAPAPKGPVAFPLRLIEPPRSIEELDGQVTWIGAALSSAERRHLKAGAEGSDDADLFISLTCWEGDSRVSRGGFVLSPVSVHAIAEMNLGITVSTVFFFGDPATRVAAMNVGSAPRSPSGLRLSIAPPPASWVSPSHEREMRNELAESVSGAEQLRGLDRAWSAIAEPKPCAAVLVHFESDSEMATLEIDAELPRFAAVINGGLSFSAQLLEGRLAQSPTPMRVDRYVRWK